jgi:hypothetical protein
MGAEKLLMREVREILILRFACCRRVPAADYAGDTMEVFHGRIGAQIFVAVMHNA